MDDFFPTNVLSLFESYQLYIIANIKPATVAKQKQSSRGVL